MFTRRKILVFVACGLAAIATLIFAWHYEAEPSYQGRVLSKWLLDYYEAPGIEEGAHSASNAVVAIRHIGTNAVPYLLKWIRYEPPKTLQSLTATAADHVSEHAVDMLADPVRESLFKSWLAVEGFVVLGTNGASAIPELIRLMKDTNNFGISAKAIAALAPLGKDAFPPILHVLASSNKALRADAMMAISQMGYLGTNVSPAIPLLINYTEDAEPLAAYALGRLQLEPQTAVPALTNCLAPTKSKTLRRSALRALERFGDKAKPAIPAILQLLSDPDADIRQRATNALQKIAPKLLTDTVPQ